jgi:hypothetical protein
MASSVWGTPRKGWTKLSPAYRGRLERNGIDRGRYERGWRLEKSRGHGTTPERPSAGYRGLAIKRGLLESLGGMSRYTFADLDHETQEKLARLYIQGFLTKGKGNIANPNRKKGTKIKRRPSLAQMEAKFEFFSTLQDEGIDFEEKEFYKALQEQSGGARTK